jgi:hypothetical protein
VLSTKANVFSGQRSVEPLDVRSSTCRPTNKATTFSGTFLDFELQSPNRSRLLTSTAHRPLAYRLFRHLRCLALNLLESLFIHSQCPAIKCCTVSEGFAGYASPQLLVRFREDPCLGTRIPVDTQIAFPHIVCPSVFVLCLLTITVFQCGYPETAEQICCP